VLLASCSSGGSGASGAVLVPVQGGGLKVSGSGVFSPRISSGGDGIGIRGVLGISPADEPQGEGIRRSAAGYIIGSQSVFVAMGTCGFMVRGCSVFFLQHALRRRRRLDTGVGEFVSKYPRDGITQKIFARPVPPLRPLHPTVGLE
jgi:hypothetical protein